MQIQQLKENLKNIVKKVVAPIDELRKRLMTLGIILSILLIITPGVLIWLDGSIRSSISNYAHSIKANGLFF